MRACDLFLLRCGQSGSQGEQNRSILFLQERIRIRDLMDALSARKGVNMGKNRAEMVSGYEE